jgi:chromosome segregation ATPase
VAKPEAPNSRPVTLRQTAKDVKLAEARQATAREELAKGRASVARARAAITRGRETLASRAKAGELDPVLAPIRANFDAAEVALNVAVEKLDAAAARLETAQRRLDEARAKALGVPVARLLR